MVSRQGLGRLALAATVAVAAAAGARASWLAFDVAPIERTLGVSQKIFYFHAPLGIWTLVLALVGAVAAAVHLVGRGPVSDQFSAACVEVMVVLCGIVLATGSLWARPAWDTWFPWGEPRVTSMLVLFLFGLAYLVVRSSVDDPGRRGRLSAVVAIACALDAVLAYFAIHLWQTLHPKVITTSGMALQDDMRRAFLWCLLAMGLVSFALAAQRFRCGQLAAGVEALEEAVNERLEALPLPDAPALTAWEGDET